MTTSIQNLRYGLRVLTKNPTAPQRGLSGQSCLLVQSSVVGFRAGNYSCRSAIIGSIREAFHAGT